MWFQAAECNAGNASSSLLLDLINNKFLVFSTENLPILNPYLPPKSENLRPHCSNFIENATPSSGTYPLASCKGVLPSGLGCSANIKFRQTYLMLSIISVHRREFSLDASKAVKFHRTPNTPHDFQNGRLLCDSCKTLWHRSLSESDWVFSDSYFKFGLSFPNVALVERIWSSFFGFILGSFPTLAIVKRRNLIWSLAPDMIEFILP